MWLEEKDSCKGFCSSCFFININIMVECEYDTAHYYCEMGVRVVLCISNSVEILFNVLCPTQEQFLFLKKRRLENCILLEL